MKQAPLHNYLDDLESFFLLLVYVMLLYRPDGSRLPSTDEGPRIIASWSVDDAEFAWANKRRILGIGGVKVRTSRLIGALWGPICSDLFQKFRSWTMSRSSDKERLKWEGKGPEHLLPKRDEYYSQVLQMFDEAIEAVRTSTIPLPEPPLTDSTFTHQLRRSARILDQLEKMSRPSPFPAGAPLSPNPQPRRSTRIQKRRLEGHDDTEVLQPKAKRTKKGPRAALRPR